MSERREEERDDRRGWVAVRQERERANRVRASVLTCGAQLAGAGARAVGCCCRWLVGRCACGLSGERERVARGPRGASRWEARPLADGVGEVGCGAHGVREPGWSERRSELGRVAGPG